MTLEEKIGEPIYHGDYCTTVADIIRLVGMHQRFYVNNGDWYGMIVNKQGEYHLEVYSLFTLINDIVVNLIDPCTLYITKVVPYTADVSSLPPL